VITVASPFWRTWVFFAMVLVLVAGLITLLFQYRLLKLEKKRKLQRAFSMELIEAHESERRRIASDLHDGIGQSLLLIKNWSDVLLRMFDFGTIQRKDIEDIRNTASDALDETRMISANLQPRHLQRFGLTSALQEMIATIADSSSIQFREEVSNIDDLLSPEAELSVYRVVQESLNNIVKHSNASNVTVKIQRVNSSIQLSIVDDGVGFDPENIHRSVPTVGKIGLNVIEERIGLLGGTYALRSNKGSGTSIAISIPFSLPSQ
jgi:signal transduction histidine kinase